MINNSPEIGINNVVYLCQYNINYIVYSYLHINFNELNF